MKKALFIAAMLIGLLAQAQKKSPATQAILDQVKKSDDKAKAVSDAKYAKDAVFFHPNAEYLYSLSKMNTETAREFADKVAFTGKTKRDFLSVRENTAGTAYIIRYIDQREDEATRFKIIKEDLECESCMDVIFAIYYQGANKALEVQGEKTLKFYYVWGSYLDLFPTWQTIFKPEADVVKTVDDYRSKEVIHRPTNINFKLEGSHDEWKIANWN